MTTEEFVEAVNAIDNRDEINAELAPDGTVSLNKCGYSLVAALGTHAIKWCLYGVDVTIPTKILKLMVELAESKEEDNKYVILNGKPMEGWSGPHENVKERTTTYSKYFTWCFFTIGNRGQYLVSHNTTDPEILTQCSYTREEVEETTEWFPEKWRNVINNLLTPLDVALEGKGNDHME